MGVGAACAKAHCDDDAVALTPHATAAAAAAACCHAGDNHGKGRSPQPQLHIHQYSIVYHDTYQVPVLLIKGMRQGDQQSSSQLPQAAVHQRGLSQLSKCNV
jgi:hypothetical protein